MFAHFIYQFGNTTKLKSAVATSSRVNFKQAAIASKEKMAEINF